MILSPHFTLSEMTVTHTSLPNIPSDFELARLKRLAETLERVREAVGDKPITINSAYRSELVNRAVGGSPKSAHMRGDAADIMCPDFGGPRSMCLAIIDAGIAFDQLILEPSWLHIGMSDKPMRHQVMTAYNGRYVPGLKL